MVSTSQFTAASSTSLRLALETVPPYQGNKARGPEAFTSGVPARPRDADHLLSLGSLHRHDQPTPVRELLDQWDRNPRPCGGNENDVVGRVGPPAQRPVSRK